MNRSIRLLMGIALTLVSGQLLAQSEPTEQNPRPSGPIIELESRVTGNREQPQVFHVVPWQTPDSPTPAYDPLQSQLWDVFGHLERDELRRQLETQGETVD